MRVHRIEISQTLKGHWRKSWAGIIKKPSELCDTFQGRKQTEQTKQTSEPDSDLAGCWNYQTRNN